MKISAWLAELDSHCIYDSVAKRADFLAKTGCTPVWGEHTERQTAKAIVSRGLGGTLERDSGKKLSYGYEMAVALASAYAPIHKCTKMGRGSAFHEAIEALVKAGK